MFVRMRRSLLIAALVALVLPAAAPGKVTILDQDSNVVDTISKGGCRVSGKKGSQDFFGSAKSDGGRFLLSIFIDAPVFTGFDEDYVIYYGGEDPQVFLRRRADEEVFGNFKIPGTPAGTVGGGGIKFSKDGRRVGVGLAPASNKSFTEGYTFAGVFKCKYRKRK